MKMKSTLLAGILACMLVLPVAALAQCSLSLSYTVTESRCKATGAVNVTVHGGSGNYNFRLIGGSIPPIVTSTSDITGVPPGTYRLEVKDVADGCVVAEDAVVVPGDYQDPRFSLSGTDVSCIDGTDGRVEVSDLQYGRAPFLFTIVAPSPSGVGTSNTTGIFNNLVPGSYYIRLTDSCGGLQTRIFTIANYNWWIDATSVTKTDCDEVNVLVTLEDNQGNFNTSGTAFNGFMYGVCITPGDTIWFSSRSFPVLKGNARSFAIVVRDHCGNTRATVWNEPNKPSVATNVSISNRACAGFRATVTGQSNLTNAQYCLYNSADELIGCNTTGVFNNVPYGHNCIRITDNCYDTIITRCFDVSRPQPTVGGTVTTNNFTCSTFRATVTGQSNLTNPEYCIYDEADNLIACNTNGVFNNLPYGSYCIRVKDDCTDTVIIRCFTSTPPVPAVGQNITITNRSCSTFDAGVSGESNLNNPQYCLYDADGNLITCNTTGDFTGLPYGSYCIHIDNNAVCYDTTIVRCFTVTPSVPSLGANVNISNRTCTGFTATVTGQTNLTNPEYCLYTADDVLITCNTTGVFNNLAYGSYTVRTTNDADCYDTVIVRNFSVSQPVPEVGAAVTLSDRRCATFTASITDQLNLTDPEYCLYDANDNQVACNTTGVFENIPYGSYCIRVVNACYDTTITRCFAASGLTPDLGVSAAASCTIGNTDLEASWPATVAPYTISVFNPGNALVYATSTSNTNAVIPPLPGLPAGLQYKVVIRDNCNATDTVLITPDASVLAKSINANSKCPGAEWQNGSGDLVVHCEYSHGSVTPRVIRKNGAVVNIPFSFSTGNIYTFTEMEPAQYVVEYTLQGCSAKVTDTFQLQSYSYPNLQQSAVYQCNDNNFSVSAAVTGGLGPFSYEIIGSIPDSPSIVAPPQANPVFSINNNNSYGLVRLRCIDACGNATTNDVSVLPLANTTISASATCYYNNITLSVDTIPNATYTWYHKTSATDSTQVGVDQHYNIPYLLPTDTGTYVCVVSVNDGCLTRISSFHLDGNCVPLYGDGLQLKGSLQNEVVMLAWTTGKDFSADAFIVEWSSDGRVFRSTGALQAASGSGGEYNKYYFTHSEPVNGANYYRLRIIKHGKPDAHSATVIVHKTGKGPQVYPNPVMQHFELRMNDMPAGHYRISLLTPDGRMVWDRQLYLQAGETKRFLRPAGMVNGTYMLLITNMASGQRKTFPVLLR